ncbi:hypothetical protein LHK59_01040 [Staphylococcus argenteus]|nr:hypothetical protein [Staphylococcus argenteus]
MDNEINKILEICEKNGEYQGDVNNEELEKLRELEKEGVINLITDSSGLGRLGTFVQVMLKNDPIIKLSGNKKMAKILILLTENGDRLIMEVVVQIATIFTLVFTGYQVYMVRKENKEKEEEKKLIKNRKIEILSNDLKSNKDSLSEASNQFEHNYQMYLKDNNQTIESKLDTMGYYILAYVNLSFIDKLEYTKVALDNYYRSSISDKHISYNTYIDVINLLNIIINDLSNAKIVLDSYIPSYDKKLIKETRDAILYEKKTDNLELITDNFNGQGNPFVINPLMYYKNHLFKYRHFFSY